MNVSQTDEELFIWQRIPNMFPVLWQVLLQVAQMSSGISGLSFANSCCLSVEEPEHLP